MGEPTLSSWSVASTPAGTLAGPGALPNDLGWLPATVPGTAAGALRAHGTWTDDATLDFDADDWWFRARAQGAAGPATLHLDGLATIADVWWNDQLVVHSENMFLAHAVPVELTGDDTLTICCRSVTEHLRARRPRPRWKTRLIEPQQLRWVRTTLFGRMPGWMPVAAPVGPWRPVRIERVADASPLATTRLEPMLAGTTGTLAYAARGTGEPPRSAVLAVAGVRAPLTIDGGADHWTISGEAVLADVQPWFPATHGSPVLHPARVLVEWGAASADIALGDVGFRSIAVDRAGGAFALRVNDVPVFCRGAVWVPPDVVQLQSAEPALRAALQQVVAAGMNMIRVPGTAVYEQDELFQLCDELGILVWHDLMFANMEYPVGDAAFASEVTAEVQQFLGRVRGRACVAVVSGGSEVEQQAAMMGVERSAIENPLGRKLLAELVEEHAPQVAYVPCSPSGGVLPFSVDTGISHYYGVGAYLRPLDDARRAGVSFTSECLAFSNVPCRETIDDVLREGERPAHSPRWKQRVPRDRGSGWDFEDVRDHYVREIFGVDPMAVRYADPDRYLDYGRAAVNVCIESSLSEWRREGSTCRGALVFVLRDPWLGAGWGIVDAAGRPKSALRAVAHCSRPVGIVATDEGLNGLAAHLLNDRGEPFAGSLRVRLFGPNSTLVASSEVDVELMPGRGTTMSVDGMFAEFRDLTYAYRFGPSTYDVVSLQLLDTTGELVDDAWYFPGGHARPRNHQLGLGASARQSGSSIEITVATTAFAQFVNIELPGAELDDDWFHLAPGDRRVVRGVVTDGRALTSGEISALNAGAPTSFTVEQVAAAGSGR